MSQTLEENSQIVVKSDCFETLVIEAIQKRVDKLLPNLLDEIIKEVLNSKKFYTAKETCKLLNMSFNSLKTFMKKGKISYASSNTKVFSEKDLVDFVRSGEWSRINYALFKANKHSYKAEGGNNEKN